jgi:hypothetical protein
LGTQRPGLGLLIAAIVNKNLDRETKVFIDESKIYKRLPNQVSEHQKINHSRGEYVRGIVHTNNVLSFQKGHARHLLTLQGKTSA